MDLSDAGSLNLESRAGDIVIERADPCIAISPQFLRAYVGLDPDDTTPIEGFTITGVDSDGALLSVSYAMLEQRYGTVQLAQRIA